MSYILNVVGDIYAATKSGAMFFTTVKSPETVLDVFTRKSGHDKQYQFRFRYSGYYLRATATKVIEATAKRDDPETFWTVEAGTGRVIDVYGFRYEAIVKDLPTEQIQPNTISIAEVGHASNPHGDEQIVHIGDHETPDNYNLHPSDPNYAWNAVINTEVYQAGLSISDKERNREEAEKKKIQMYLIAGALVLGGVIYFWTRKK